MDGKDRRHSTRKILSQEVMLSHGRGFRMCKLHDISLASAMLKIGWSALTRDAAVELSIDLTVSGDIATFRLPAKVMRVTTHGTVVEFTNLDAKTFSALAKYLHAQ